MRWSRPGPRSPRGPGPRPARVPPRVPHLRAALRRAVDDDEGSVTVTAAFAAATILALIVAVLLVGRAAVAAHSVRAAADLSALAGAHALRAGEDACGEAARVAAGNGAAVARCTVDGHDVVIRADVRVELGVFGARSATATARAGPV